MHKLKQAFSKKDDSQPQPNAATGEPVEPERRRSSIMRQILNPGGDRYEEEIHGTPATVTPAVPNAANLKTDPEVKLAADPNQQPEGKKSGGILDQLVNPDGKKFDETRHGITAVPVEGTGAGSVPGHLQRDRYVRNEQSEGILRQNFHANGGNYSEQKYDTTTGPYLDPNPSGSSGAAGSRT